MAVNKRLIPRASGVTLSEHYEVVEYTGNSTSSRSITGLSFSPDVILFVRYHTSSYAHKILVMKVDGTASNGNHYWYEFGGSGKRLDSSGRFDSFDSGGFTIGSNSDLNGNGYQFMAFCWKVGGNTANPDVNSDTGSASYTNISHGLGTSNVFPIIKTRDSNYNWTGRPIGISWTDYCRISYGGCADDYWTWQDTSASSSSVRIGVREWVNLNNQPMVMWTFSPVDGVSSMGTYTGNGSSTDGPEINCGFQPSMVWVGTGVEGSNTATVLCSNRYQTDNSNLRSTNLSSNSAWYTSSTTFEFTSTGFKVNSQYSTTNGNGDTYWYMAWADPDIVG